ncbi:MAG: C4-dicarboxylate ABC transporter substrate-binding protein, partial [Pseudomonadota bacterium]
RSIQYNEFTVNELGKNGMTTGRVSDTMAGELRAIGETMTGEWLETAGDQGKAIVDAFKAKQ